MAENNFDCKVLWLEDNQNIVNVVCMQAKSNSYNIDLVRVSDWETAYKKLNWDFGEYSAIIFGDGCKIEGLESESFCNKVLSSLYKLFENKQKELPYYFYIEKPSASKKNFDKEMKTFSSSYNRKNDWGQMVFLKDETDSNLDALCKLIRRVVSKIKEDDIKFKYSKEEIKHISDEVSCIIEYYKKVVKLKNSRLYKNCILYLLVSLYKKQLKGKELENCIEGINLNEYNIVLSKYLSDGDINRLLAEYREIVNQYYNRQINKGVINPIVDLFAHIANLSSNSRVYLPNLYRNTIFNYNIGCHYDIFNYYYDEEYDEEESPLAQNTNLIVMYLYVQMFKCDVNIKVYNSIQDAIDKEFKDDKQYEYILITNFCSRKLKIDNELVLLLIDKKLIFNSELWLYLSLGRCYDIVFSDEFHDFMKEHQYTVQIMELPSRIRLPYSHTNMCILRIMKNGIDSLELYDFSNREFFNESCGLSYYYCNLNYQKIQDILINKQKEYSWCSNLKNVNIKKILYPSAQIALNIADEELIQSGKPYVLLKDYISIINLPIKEDCRGIPIISIKELSDEDFLIPVIPIDQEMKQKLRYLTEDCLLISCVSGRLKIGQVEGLNSDRGCLLTPDIYAIRVNKNIVNEKYLQYKLVSKEVNKIVNIIISGVTDDEKNNIEVISEYLRIECPSIPEQEEIVNKVIMEQVSENNDRNNKLLKYSTIKKNNVYKTENQEQKPVPHNPKATRDFLSEFSRSDECKWFTHRADCDILLETYAEVAENFLWKYKDKVSYETWQNVRNFISLKDEYVNVPWENYAGEKIRYHWNSVKKWMQENPDKDPFDCIVDDENKFSYYIQQFKHTIQFRTDNREMLFYRRIKQWLKIKLGNNDIKVTYSETFRSLGSSIYTFVDVRIFFQILKDVCDWIYDHKKESNYVDIDLLAPENKDYHEFIILHRGSYLNIPEVKMKGLSGDLNKLRVLAFNNLDLEIDADCGSSLDKLEGKKLICMNENVKGIRIKDKPYYKIEQGIVPLECEKVGGVKYIFRFYKLS